MPSAGIVDACVCGVRPSLVAAPAGPDTRPRHAVVYPRAADHGLLPHTADVHEVLHGLRPSRSMYGSIRSACATALFTMRRWVSAQHRLFMKKSTCPKIRAATSRWAIPGLVSSSKASPGSLVRTVPYIGHPGMPAPSPAGQQPRGV